MRADRAAQSDVDRSRDGVFLDRDGIEFARLLRGGLRAAHRRFVVVVGMVAVLVAADEIGDLPGPFTPGARTGAGAVPPCRTTARRRGYTRILARGAPVGGPRRDLPRPARHPGQRRAFRAARIESRREVRVPAGTIGGARRMRHPRGLRRRDRTVPHLRAGARARSVRQTRTGNAAARRPRHLRIRHVDPGRRHRRRPAVEGQIDALTSPSRDSRRRILAGADRPRPPGRIGSTEHR